MKSDSFLEEDWGSQRIAVPNEKTLKQKQNWAFDSTKKEYFAKRHHFLLEKRPLVKFGYGRAIGIYGGEGAEVREEIRRNIHVEYLNEREYIYQKLRELSASSQLGLKDLPFLDVKVGGGVKATVTENTKESIEQKIVKEESITKSIYIPSDQKERKILPTTYQKFAVDVHFIGVDYLTVTYKTSLFGLFKKRKKYPELTNNQQYHNNFKLYDVPVCTIHFWSYLPLSLELIPESKYESSLIDPFEIENLRPQRPALKHISGPFKPTLYNISNEAFPLKKRDQPLLEIENSN